MMKKILFFIVLIFSAASVRGQFPVNSTLGNKNTTVLTRGIHAADSAFRWVTNYPDTATANFGGLKYIPGSAILVDNKILIRNQTATGWISQGGGSYTFTNGITESGGTVSWDSVHVYNELGAKADSLRRSGLAVQMRKNGSWTTQYTDSVGVGTDTISLSNRIDQKLNITDTANIKPRLYAGTNITITGTYPNQTIASTGGGGADSSVFATNYRVDTAKTNLRTSIAAKVSGSGASNRVSLWNGTSTLTSMAQYTFNSSTSYPDITIGAAGSVGSSLVLRDAAGTNMLFSSDGGYLGIYGSSTYKNVQIYSHAGGSLMAQFYRPSGTYNLINLNGLIASNDLTVLSNYQGNFHIVRTVPYLVTGNNYHGFTDGTDFRQGNSAFNSFGSFVSFGNNRTNQDHYAAFQNVWTKDSTNTMSKVYGFVNAVSEMKGGGITDLYGYYHYSPTVTGGTITNQYGIYVPTVTGATNNVGAFFGSKVTLSQGTDVASAAGAITLSTNGNTFEITGTAAITLISNVGWVNGSEINLVFTSTASLTDGTANSGTDIGMELEGNTNFTGSADDIVTLVLCEVGGTQRWRMKSKSVN